MSSGKNRPPGSDRYKRHDYHARKKRRNRWLLYLSVVVMAALFFLVLALHQSTTTTLKEAERILLPAPKAESLHDVIHSPH